MTLLTNEQRALLRKAVNAHPDLRTVAPDVHVSSLNKADLFALAAKLGIVIGNVTTDTCEVTAMPANEPAPTPEPDDVESEVSRIRGLLATGGFSQLDTIITDLVREARKPAAIVYTSTSTGDVDAAPLAKPVRQETWGKVFGLRGAMASRTVTVWDATDAPAVDDKYVWPTHTPAVLSQLARKRHVFLTGPKGVGKTSFAEQLAARLHRPFTVISCDGGLEAIELIGQNLPKDGAFVWQDGQLLHAIRRPGTVVLIDEPSIARPSALFVFQHLLQFREIYIRETGERVPVAPGVCFLAADNTNGTGGGARRGYTDTNRLNAATLDRFGIMVNVDYLTPEKESNVLVSRTGCTPELAQILVASAHLTRTVAASGNLVAPISLRQLISWAELLTDGIDPNDALSLAVLNKASEADVETLRQQCLLTIDKAAIATALQGKLPATPAAPVTPGQFQPIDENEEN